MSIFGFDQTGRAPGNLIQNEEQTITSINGSNLNYFVPVNAPFFKEGLAIVDKDTGLSLREGVDFVYGHKFQEADDNLGRGVYGSIGFLDPNKTGSFYLNYQTLGGDFVTNATQTIANGLSTLSGLTTLDWTDLSGLPPVWPPTTHTQPLSDVDALVEFLTIMTSIRDRIADPFNSLTLADVEDLDSEFVLPVTDGLKSIAAAIQAKALQTTIPYEQATYAGTTDVDLGATPAGTWIDSGLEVTVPSNGTYRVSHATDPNPTPNNEKWQVRFVVDGGTIATSYINNVKTALTAGQKVKMQIRTLSISTNFYVAREGQGANLSIERFGN